MVGTHCPHQQHIPNFLVPSFLIIIASMMLIFCIYGVNGNGTRHDIIDECGGKKRCKFEEIAHSESKKLTEVLMCIFGIIELFVK